MKSAQFFKYTTWAMLILNLAMLSFFFFRNGYHGKNLRAIDTLQLDGQQHELFLASAKKHKIEIVDIQEQQKRMLRPYFKQLVLENKELDEEVLLMAMEQLESQKIKATYQHFLEIKNILKEDQLANFEHFMDRMLTKILIENKKN